jgi:hypothetical protein
MIIDQFFFFYFDRSKKSCNFFSILFQYQMQIDRDRSESIWRFFCGEGLVRYVLVFSHFVEDVKIIINIIF